MIAREKASNDDGIAVADVLFVRFDKLALAAVLSTALVTSLVACGSETADEDEGSADSALTGSSANDKTAFAFFVGKGLTKTQAAAIVGNLDQESSMNPNAKQSGGPGRGIAQWSLSARWRTENTYAKSIGGSATSLQTQLDFIWHELTTNSAFGLSSLKRATSIASAVQIFQSKYEICGACNAGSRLTFAKKALAAFGNTVSASVQDAPATGDDDDDDSAEPAPTPSATTTTTPGTGTGTGTTPSTTGDDDDDTSADGGVSQDPAGDCIVDNTFGSCIDTGACAAQSGTSTPGLCPGAVNIQCCTF